jgi:hypothetical protein
MAWFGFSKIHVGHEMKLKQCCKATWTLSDDPGFVIIGESRMYRPCGVYMTRCLRTTGEAFVLRAWVDLSRIHVLYLRRSSTASGE